MVCLENAAAESRRSHEMLRGEPTIPLNFMMVYGRALGFMICALHHPILLPLPDRNWAKMKKAKTKEDIFLLRVISEGWLFRAEVWGLSEKTGGSFIFVSNGECSWSVKWINKESTFICSISQDQGWLWWTITLGLHKALYSGSSGQGSARNLRSGAGKPGATPILLTQQVEACYSLSLSEFTLLFHWIRSHYSCWETTSSPASFSGLASSSGDYGDVFGTQGRLGRRPGAL